MAMSIQTNVNSLLAQENLRVNNDFQSKTIQRITSGFRINASGDDAAGLAVANKFRSDVTELTQGVRNANDGLSQLQIIDGGLGNISKMLDRMKTLATQSASTTFTGSRTTLNNEYQDLLLEINRQAANVGLSNESTEAGKYNKQISVYIGGALGSQSNAQVTVDLSGAANRVDTAALGLASTKVSAGSGTAITNSRTDLNSASTVLFNSGATQVLTFNMQNTSIDVTVRGDSDGITVSDALAQINNAVGSYGISASIDSAGKLAFGSANTAFSVHAAAASASGEGFTTLLTTGDAINQSMYYVQGQTTYDGITAAGTISVGFTVAGNAVGPVSLDSTDTVDTAINKINTVTAASGLYAVKNSQGTGIDFMGTSTFTLTETPGGAATAADGIFSDSTGHSANSPTASGSDTANALNAITQINTAVTNLGLVQGKVGTGQNKLQYAINLGQSQIANFSAAESRIRDADIAAEAANLTKAQVLSQASMAAMAQANSAPQQVLSLLRG